MPTTREVATKLVELINQKKNLEAVNQLYADNIVSLDAHGDEKMPKRMEGKQAVLGKNKWFFDNHEIHASTSRPALYNEDRFTLIMNIDVTPKVGPMKGKRMQMEEVGVYTVKNGKIVEEAFFYDMGQ